MLGWYNGFSGEQREQGDKIIKQAIRDGVLKPLSEQKCSMCGQDKGIKHYHCEDYSPENILADVRPLCWTCHMMLHCRFKHPKSWAKYQKDIAESGKKEAVYHHNFSLLDKYFID